MSYDGYVRPRWPRRPSARERELLRRVNARPGQPFQLDLFQSTARKGGENMAKQATRRRRDPEPKTKREGRKRRQEREYQEQPGWGSVFHRPDNEGNQPQFTGQGLDVEGNPIEIAVWVRKSLRGVKYLRVHIQEPYDADTDDELDADLPEDDEREDEDEDDDDVPF